MIFSKIQFSLLLNIVVTCIYSQPLYTWQDKSPHHIQFVTVEKNVKLEILDWGGHGKPVILLAGGGNTAHVFDNFAPKLTSNFHVYGITRRGFGASQFAQIDSKDRLGEDILAVIDTLNIIKPVLVGHSIAGAELSTVARISPNQISALIYLEAGYPYAFQSQESPTMTEFMETTGPKQPTPKEKDLANFKALQKWDTETYGFQKPESEFRQTWDSTLEGRPSHPHNFPGFTIFPIMLSDSLKHDNISLPSLVIFAIPHMKEAWMTKIPDQKVRSDAQGFLMKIDSLATKQAKAFKSGVPTAQVITFKGMHYIYISNESEILKVIRRFIYGLK